MNTKILKKLGISLKHLREQKGYTQEELAAKVGIHPTYVGKLETGKNNTNVIKLFKISRALGVKLTDIFEFDK